VKKLKMKRSTILKAVVALSLAVTIAIAAFAPTTVSLPYTPQIVKYGTFGHVPVQIPSNTTPPGQPGTSNHPTTLIFEAYDATRMATFPGVDELSVYLWDPGDKAYTPVAVITNNGYEADFMKMIWNMTYVHYPISPTTDLFPNVIQVAPNELEVWTSDGALFVNLTKPVKVTLPIFPTGTSATGNQTFILPPLTLEFRGIGDAFQDTINAIYTGFPGSSNYTMKGNPMTQPAWMRIAIPDWTSFTQLEFIGHTMTGGLYYVPP
jgi:hypothetical protein